MIRKAAFFGFLLLLTVPVHAQMQLDVQKEFAFAAQQDKRLLRAHPDRSQFPHSTNPDDSRRDKPSEWWCSGIFGGSLWFIYEQIKDVKWKTAADRWTMAMAKEQTNMGTHDLGFMLYCPFGNGYRLTQNPAHRSVLLTGAQSLSTHFDLAIGVSKSWNSLGEYTYPVIIDNMMNLELLFWAAQQSGDKRLYNLSVSHADSTLKNHFRSDHSSYHVVCYAPVGKVLRRQTHQGAADESAWARGQAWGLYGYTVMYRETKDPKYPAQARRIADFYLNHPNLSADKVPYWDFNAPNILNEERDASAAALLKLCTYGNTPSQPYYRAAVQMLQSLANPAYKAKLGENNNFLLRHSMGAKPLKSELDMPLV